MDLNGFNSINTKQLYTYRKNPMHSQSYMIMKRSAEDQSFAPFGEYTVLDHEEPTSLTERKVMNLVTRLNGLDRVIDIKEDVDGRLLYHKVHDAQDAGGKSKVVFYTLGKKGVSKENAVLTFEGGFNDKLS